VTHLEHSVEFQTTAWTLLGQLREGDPDTREAAMHSIVVRYWPAVYSAVRAMGRTRDDAADTTQSFFMDVVIKRGLFHGASPQRGRLRCLIRTAIKHFVIDYHRQQRAGGLQFLNVAAIEHEETGVLANGSDDPDRAFDRRWAAAIIDEALVRCERHFHGTGKPAHWEIFHARCILPALHACEPLPMARLAAEYGFQSAAYATAAIDVVRKRFKALLGQVVSETTEEDAEAELAYLMGLLNLSL
jgi:DNA-directed RNA polymerase specialized sigma24 family protein